MGQRIGNTLVIFSAFVSAQARSGRTAATDRRIQPVDATIWLNRSAGVSKFSVFRGRSLSRLATAFSLACE